LLRYEKNIKLAGIIYLHRITDNRMSGTPHRNIRMLGELCGDQAAKKVVLVTTMWDEVQQDTGVFREIELFEKYWNTMISYGASTARFSNSANSAWEIIGSILFVQELVDHKKPFSETKAGKTFESKKDSDATFKQLKIHRKFLDTCRRWQGGLKNDLSPDDIIIAFVIACIYFICIEYIYVASWAQLVLGKALYVSSSHVNLAKHLHL
jgi:hypothetical protein